MHRIALMALGTAALFTQLACDPQPCDRYVDYICTCHDGEEDFDCEELQQVLAGADPTVQDQCAIDLAEQQNEDDAAGLQCDAP